MAGINNLHLSTEFTKTLDDAKATLTIIRDSYLVLFDELSRDIRKHSESEHSIPNVSAKIGKPGISAVKAMMAVNSAAFEGQKLTNTYNSIYAPRMNELFYDAKEVINTITHRFYLEQLFRKLRHLQKKTDKETHTVSKLTKSGVKLGNTQTACSS